MRKLTIAGIFAFMLLLAQGLDLVTLPGAEPTPVAAFGVTGSIPDYDRDEFGRAWADVDHNGCDTRNDILARDLEHESLRADHCTVMSGTLFDVYTGRVIEFRRGPRTSDDVQIDHIVPLSWAWRAGAWSWDPQRRVQFANDPANLRAVDGPTNSAKGDSGPSEWMPQDRCWYVEQWAAVVALYDLRPPAADAIATTRLECQQ